MLSDTLANSCHGRGTPALASRRPQGSRLQVAPLVAPLGCNQSRGLRRTPRMDAARARSSRRSLTRTTSSDCCSLCARLSLAPTLLLARPSRCKIWCRAASEAKNCRRSSSELLPKTTRPSTTAGSPCARLLQCAWCRAFDMSSSAFARNTPSHDDELGVY